MVARQMHSKEYHEADLIAACDSVVALVERADRHIYPNTKIDQITDEVARLLDQIVSMRATTLAGFKARARTLSVIYPNIASENEPDALVAALVRDLITAS